jgi:hypothetical protein
MIPAQGEFVQEQRGIVQGREMRVTLESVMMPWISVLPNPSLMALPVMTDSSARFLKRVPLGHALVLF